MSRIKKCNFSWSKTHYEIKPTAVFALSALVFSVFHLLLLFMTKYPGILSEDSMSQIGQILSGEYSNHHPFYHTQIIRLFITIGFALFGEINAAIAVYSTFQVLLMACCFAFVSVTLYQMNISCRWIALCNLWYILMPFHIMYSFTMWKDVLFGGMLLVFTTAVYRLQKGIGRYQAVNYILTALGGICVCLLRSNGWIVFLFSSVLFIILFREKYKWLKVVFAGILVLTYVMTHPVLKWLDVSQVNIVEALSIPIQQIARVVKDCDDLNEEQTELLNKVVDVDKLSEAYNPVISDPVKDLIRAKENTDYIKEHKGDFLKLWLKLGITHPGSYMAAWIDQTRGYWDSGFPYWRWANVVVENDMGIHQTINAPYINKILNEYLWLYENVGALQIFLCIGFYVWIIVLLGYINMLRRDKAAVFSIVPSLALIASLLLASPVYSEFRYAYGVFCMIPFLTAASFYKNEG